jgi:predicted transcriptional regulator
MKRSPPDVLHPWIFDSGVKDGDLRGLLRALRSGNATPEVCALAADLLEGKIKLPKHRPKHPKPWEEVVRPALRVRELERQGWRKRTAAVAQTAKELGISRAAVQVSLAECEGTLNLGERMAALVEYISRYATDEDAGMSVAEYISKKVLT